MDKKEEEILQNTEGYQQYEDCLLYTSLQKAVFLL